MLGRKGRASIPASMAMAERLDGKSLRQQGGWQGLMRTKVGIWLHGYELPNPLFARLKDRAFSERLSLKQLTSINRILLG